MKRTANWVSGVSLVLSVFALVVSLVVLSGCSSRKASNNQGDATAASAYIQECKLIGANTVHVVGKVLGTSDYGTLVMTVRVQEQVEPGEVRGEKTVILEHVEDGFLGNTDIQVGEGMVEPVCTVADVTAPGGKPL